MSEVPNRIGGPSRRLQIAQDRQRRAERGGPRNLLGIVGVESENLFTSSGEIGSRDPPRDLELQRFLRFIERVDGRRQGERIAVHASDGDDHLVVTLRDVAARLRRRQRVVHGQDERQTGNERNLGRLRLGPAGGHEEQKDAGTGESECAHDSHRQQTFLMPLADVECGMRLMIVLSMAMSSMALEAITLQSGTRGTAGNTAPGACSVLTRELVTARRKPCWPN